MNTGGRNLKTVRTGTCSEAIRPQPAPIVTCAECKSEFGLEDVIILGGVYCCSRCKPILLQKLREGGTNTLPALLGITYRSTRAATWRCNLYAVFHNKRVALVLGASIILLSVRLPLPALSSNAFANFTFGLIAAAAAVALLHLVVLTLAVLKRFPTAKTIRTCTSGLAAEGVSDITPEKRRLVPWRKITEIREHNGDIHVWFGFSGIFIPRDAFKDLNEAQRFVDLAVELWRSKGSLWPEAVAKYRRST